MFLLIVAPNSLLRQVQWCLLNMTPPHGPDLLLFLCLSEMYIQERKYFTGEKDEYSKLEKAPIMHFSFSHIT